MFELKRQGYLPFLLTREFNVKNLFFAHLIFFQGILLSQNNFNLDLDYSRFSTDTTTGYLELYYGFYTSQLQPVESPDGKVVRGMLNIEIINDDSGIIELNKTYQFESPLPDSNSTEINKNLIGVLGFPLKYGNYICKVIGWDANNPSGSDSILFTTNLDFNNNESFYSSDLQLATSINKASENTNSPFYKNTYEIIPNPAGVFGESLPVIFFYSELYNLDKDLKEEKLRVDYLMVNTLGDTVLEKHKRFPRTHSSIVDVGVLNISKLPSGSYTLLQVISDSILNSSHITSKKVYVYNPNVIDSSTIYISNSDLTLSEFDIMSEEELDKVFEESKYIAIKQEIDQWARLSEEDSKRKFLVKFWKARIYNPEYPGQNFKNEYFSRIEYASQQYSSFRREGWRTDRGRIYVLFGEPSEIQRFPNEPEMKPYQIWKYYHIEGGVIFVFADIYGFSDYVLLHSSKRGELRDDNWQGKVIVY